MPIWPEAYEQYAPLIKENQLVLMVLSVEKEEGIKYQVKALYDLTSLDEDKLKIVEQLVTKAAGAIRQPKGEKKGFRGYKSEEKVMKKKWILSLESNILSLQQILDMKNLFRAHPGQSPLEINFFDQKKKLGQVQIDSHWGVSDNLEWVEKIKNYSALIQIEYVEIS